MLSPATPAANTDAAASLGLSAPATARLRALLAADARRAAVGGGGERGELTAAYRGVPAAAVMVGPRGGVAGERFGGGGSSSGSGPAGLDAATAAGLAVAAARSACGRAAAPAAAVDALLVDLATPGGVGEAYEAEVIKALGGRVGAGGGDWTRCPRAVARFGRAAGV
ncbi:hypothetical protein MMPV_003214 [Pyropia vietnamensis]